MRRIVLALLALAVLLPSLAEARARWLTDVDVYVRHECCCPPAKVRHAPPVSTLQKTCCTFEKRSATALPLVRPSSDPSPAVALAMPIAIVPVLPPLRSAVVAIVPRAQAPPASTLLAQSRGLLL